MLYDDIKRRLTEWVELHQATRRLRQLDGRLLADMGIERNSIADLVRGRCAR
jgi:uncharacterized protein YjiS (DUF1127 family)